MVLSFSSDTRESGSKRKNWSGQGGSGGNEGRREGLILREHRGQGLRSRSFIM